MDEGQSPHSKKNKTMTLKVNRKLFLVLLAVAVLLVTFFIGKSYGVSQQKEADKKNNPLTSRTNGNSSVSNRWTSVGTVIEVSDKSIKIKDSRDQEKTASITKETKIVNRKGESLSAKDLKKDQKVIVSGTKDEKDEKKLTATRIRLQQ